MADALPFSLHVRWAVSHGNHRATKELVMKTRKSVLVCVLALLVGGLAFKSYIPTRGQTTTPQLPASATVGTRESPSPSQAPEHIVYRQFFRHLVALKQRAEGMESQGKNGKALRTHYKDKIGLKDKEASLLDEIATECERETAKIDERAQRIIEAARARFSNGRAASIEEIPPPPPELKKLQRHRDMVVMRARHRLVTELGAYGFQQIDDFLKLNFARDVRPAAVQPKQLRTNQQQPANQ
jgi:hypothetical protein